MRIQRSFIATAIILFTTMVGMAAEILPVDQSEGGLIFVLKDHRVLCHIWKPEGLLNNGDMSCRWNPQAMTEPIDESPAQFAFDSHGYAFEVERKKIGESLCYTMRSGSSGAISCL